MRVNSALDLAAAIKGRRRDLHVTQTTTARRAGVARSWLAKVESGKASVDFGLVLKVLDALELRIDVAPSSTSRATDVSSSPGSSPHGTPDVFKGPRVDLDDLLDQQRRL